MTMTDPEDTRGTLSGTLRAVADEDSGLGASPTVEAALREAVRAMRQTERGRVSPVFVVAAAALTVIVVGSWRLVATRPPAADHLVTREVATDFLPLMYGHLPATDVYIVRLEVPRSALIGFGLTSVELPTVGRETIDADVLVGMDGIARAVRFVHQVRSQE
jgi:hypothetical protein